MHSLAVVLTIFALLCTCSLAPAAPATRPATLTRDVVYGTADGVTLRLDASVPAGDGPFAAVILVHGGSWQAGDKTHFHSLFDPLTNAGLAWFSVNYRLAPVHPFPACRDDVETAVRWVKAHAAEYHVDPDRIALLGESAGGHLAELVATRATVDSGTRTAAVVAMYAPSDLSALAARFEARGVSILPMLRSIFGRDSMDDTTKAMIADASPLTHVHAGLPPFLLIHGTADQLVPFAQSVAFQSALKAVGVQCDLIAVPNGPHGMMFWNLLDPSYKDCILAFLGSTLKAKG